VHLFRLVFRGCCSSLVLVAGLLVSRANERNFSYTYEPETMPQGGFEYEQSITLRAGRNAAVGQEDFRLWEFRHEFEYGLTDNYTISLYVNHSLETFREPGIGKPFSDYNFDGISIENRYLVLNPVDHPLGLAFYLEPRYAGDNAELEQKIILGQRYGDWKWALNFTHATEWTDYWRQTEGEFEVSLGVDRHFAKHWSVGLEARDHNELPDYRQWENTAFYLGPVVSYQREHWWATLTVMPQIFGRNFVDNPSQSDHLDLEGHERWNARLLVGVGF
jgi:hypothetical protein